MTYRSLRIFREEALARLDRSDEGGRPLQLSPRFIGWTFWLLASVATASLTFASLADLGEYAHGAAVVRVQGRVPVAATGEGVVEALVVQPGQRVQEGEVLVRFHDASERAELQRLDQQIEAELTHYLRHPGDESKKRELAALHAQRDLARSQLAQRVVRAPAAGIVSDARIRPGQSIAPGQVLLTLRADGAEGEVVAVLPGHYRPLLQPGMGLQIELSGFPHHPQRLRIESIGDEIIGPEEVKRFFGAERGDTLPLSGPLVLVRAQLQGHTFEVGEHSYAYFDGMQGDVEVRVRAQSILTTLVPGLDGLVHAR